VVARRLVASFLRAPYRARSRSRRALRRRARPPAARPDGRAAGRMPGRGALSMSLDEIDRPPADATTPKPASRPLPDTAMPGPRGRRAGSRRLARLLAALATAAALIAGGVSWWLEARHWVTTDDAFIDAHIVLIAPQVAGRVARVAVGDNERVVAGQLLVALDPAEYRAKLDQAAANRAAAAGGLA